MRFILITVLVVAEWQQAHAQDPTEPEFSIEVTKAFSGFDKKTCWVHARAGIIPRQNSAVAIMTTQKLLLSGSDVFSGLHQSNSVDCGKSWSPLRCLPNFTRQTFNGPEGPLPTGAEVAAHLLKRGDQVTVCDFVPQWHARSDRLLGIGQTVWYRDNKVIHVRPRGSAYSVFDEEAGEWSAWKCVEFPDEPKFQCAGSGSQQRFDLPNGDVLLPVYLKTPEEKQYASMVCRCSFDGETLKYVEHGNSLTIPVKRGLYEPSITKYGDKFYLTLRNDDHGYVSVSDDGLNFSPPRKWTFDDGADLGNYNTQQHWITHSDGLWLVYTRKGADNDHVFRHRAPLFIARVDAKNLNVIRSTEQILVQERGARLGNFGVTNVSPNESWVTVTEWMQPVGVEKHGSDNTIWVAKIHWNQPNRLVSSQSVPDELPTVSPELTGMNGQRLAVIDDVVNEGLRRKKMPGCVVLVGHQGKIVFHRAYGHRQLVPQKQPMKLNTVFDMASLTKPIATATSIMLLVEEGKVKLEDPVAKYLPEFGANGKASIKVRQLLTHSGGLIPDNSLNDYRNGPREAFEKINALGTYVEPGTKFVYTDVGFIVLAKLVEQLTGKNVHDFSQQHIFGPLGMKETGYLPSEELRQRCAVTQEREGRWMRGEVHDPRAYALGGVAGHAGLFSTATDLAKYCQMMIQQGKLGDVKILKPTTMKRMTAPETVSSGLRTLGWDMRSPYSSNRGDLFSRTAFGHGGFTGTAMWIDPAQQLFVIFLSNRVHPDGKGSVNTIAGRIGTIAAAAIQGNESN